MNRSKKIVVVSHCILNANAKVRPLAVYPGVLRTIMDQYIESGTGLFQLPCPESSYLGINRWGMGFEQYNTARFRRHCQSILEPCLDQLENFAGAGYEIVGVIGANGSPNCGVHKIPAGLDGGVIGQAEPVEIQLEKLEFKRGMGVFFTVLKEMMNDRGLSASFMAVDEDDPTTLQKYDVRKNLPAV